MNITDVIIRKISNAGRLRAIVSITLDGDFAIHEIKIIEGKERLFIAMPSSVDKSGVFRDITHPISQAARDCLENTILEKYNGYLAKLEIDPDESLTEYNNNHGMPCPDLTKA